MALVLYYVYLANQGSNQQPGAPQQHEPHQQGAARLQGQRPAHGGNPMDFLHVRVSSFCTLSMVCTNFLTFATVSGKPVPRACERYVAELPERAPAAALSAAGPPR